MEKISDRELLLLFVKNQQEIEELRTLLDKDKDKDKNNKKQKKNGYVYLLQEREFVNSGEQVFKLGKTTKPNSRFNNYPKGSILFLNLPCNNCHYTEKEIIKIFDEKFKQRQDIGREYYEGDIEEMCKEFTAFVFLFY